LPIYTYECQSCSDTLERRQSFSDEPLTTHDECGGSLRRIIHPAGIVFKGSGFYNTDYKNATPSTKPADASADAKKTDTAASDSSATPSASSGDAASTSSTPAPASSTPSSTPAASTP